MTVWASPDFMGGAIGATVTTSTVPQFSTVSHPTLTHEAAISGVPGQSLQLSGASTGSCTVSFAGRTAVTVGAFIERVSGAQASLTLFMLLVDGATNRSDVILRQTTGDKWAARGDTAGATNYYANSARTMATGEVYYIELEWLQGTGTKARFWYPGNATNTPDELYPASGFQANTNAVTGVRLGNSGGASGTTIKFAGLKLSDGGQIRGSEPTYPVPADLNAGSGALERGWYAARSGLASGSLSDHKLAYLRTLTGLSAGSIDDLESVAAIDWTSTSDLTPARQYSLADHKLATYKKG